MLSNMADIVDSCSMKGANRDEIPKKVPELNSI